MIRGHGAKQRRLWWSAIKALLSEGETGAAADKIGVSRGTLLRWLKDGDFRDSLEQARERFNRAALDVLEKQFREEAEAIAAH